MLRSQRRGRDPPCWLSEKEPLVGKRRVNFQRCWLPVSRIGLHRRGVERVNCGPKLLTWVKRAFILPIRGRLFFLYVHWAIEGAPFGMRCVCISPGYIQTPGTAFLADTPAHQQMIDHGLIKRAGVPEDIVELAVFLASDKASFITGTNYVVDGGRMLGGQ